jgi:hypothetical protein
VSLNVQELRDLFKKYKERMESEGKKVRTGGGFGGTGFKFDEAEAQYTTEKKKYQKAAFGLQVRTTGAAGIVLDSKLPATHFPKIDICI